MKYIYLLFFIVFGTAAYAAPACTDGSCECMQSPINITNYVDADLPDIKFQYGNIKSKVTLKDDKFLVEPIPSDRGVYLEKTFFTLQQFHTHVPSEHHIKGKAADMEIHFVHQNKEGMLSVIGVLVAEGKANSELDKIIKQLKSSSEAEITIDYNKLLPADKRYFLLMGSLTTAPYKEGIRWQVLTHHITASKEQIAFFAKHHSYGARPIMPENHRLILRDIRSE